MGDRPSNWPQIGGEDPDFDGLSFDLSYIHCPNRRIGHDGFGGPALSDANDPERTSPGSWSAWLDDHAHDPVRMVLVEAIKEAVHEACEWVRFEGVPLIDPHGTGEGIVDAAAHDCGVRIFEAILARAGSSDG